MANKGTLTANKIWTKEAVGLGYVDMHKPVMGEKKHKNISKKTNKNKNNNKKHCKILKCYFVVTGENSEFCLLFNLSVPEVNKTEES